MSSWIKTAFYTFVLLLSGITLLAQSAPCPVKAGTLKKTSICLLNGQTLLKATHRGDTLAPRNYQVAYLLTHGDEQVIEQMATEAIFELPAYDSLSGVYTIHTLVYDPATLNLGNIVFNSTKLAQVNDLLIQGNGIVCAALDLEGAQIEFGECTLPCKASAGRLVADAVSCLANNGNQDVTLKAQVQTAPVIPPGYTHLYALVYQETGEILRVGDTPFFNVMVPGKFSIHTLVYDPTTLNLNQLYEAGTVTLASIDTLLVQGGGSVCGALDKVGASFEVVACPQPCQVKAGSLAVDINPCLKDSSVTIRAVTKDNPVIPTGHQIRYLLSSGAGKVVQQISTTPSFAVSDTGVYAIHTMVYDSTTFQLDSIALGSIQVAALNTRLDSICGAVDVTGAVFNVRACPPFICSAKVGTLIAKDSTCLFNGKAKLSANVPIGPLVPAGFRNVYLLTTGDSLIIQQIGATPDFEVTRTGRFAIQGFVVDTTVFKLDSIKIGVTTASDLNALLLQGGGNICGALDTTGIVFNLNECLACPANAGTLTSNTVPCLENGAATLTVYNLDPPVVPSGFKLAYLLTNSNKVIEQISDSASFVVNSMAVYNIHTLVYDFTLLNLNTVVTPGVTNLNAVNSQLIQGGGTQCGALDTKGFSFFVLPCETTCDADAGTLKRINEPCLQNNQATIEATSDEAPVVPDGFQVRYLLSVGNGQIIRQINTTPSFLVTNQDTYTIHTLVYNPQELDINNIKIDVTSVREVDSWLLPNGDACGAVDKRGVKFEVLDCLDYCDVEAGSLGNANSFVCISNGSATLSAFIVNQSYVLSGFEVKYLLAFGNNMVIQQASDNPVFRVNRTGRYTIHTLVYDPNTFNVNTQVSGASTINMLHEQLIQGGGTICGALNLNGTAFQVSICTGGADSGDEASQLRAYPNPSTQKVNVVLPQVDKVDQIDIELIDSNGDVARQWKVDGYTPSLNLDIADVKPGVYYIRVLYDHQFVQQTSIIRAQ
ncbi:MAG: T9SS type A sorting domain-containing protein [Saprospiraceae bacterium]